MISTELTHRILIKLQNLPEGQSIHSRQLEEEYQITGSKVRKIMEILQRSGHRIVRSVSNGYKIAKTLEEFLESNRKYRNRGLSIIKTARKSEIMAGIGQDNFFSIMSEINSISDKQIIGE